MAKTADEEIAEILGLPQSPAVMGGAYEASSRFDRSFALWAPPSQAADQDIIPEKTTVDARSRDMVRNDAYAMAGVRLHKDNIVGVRYTLNAKPMIRLLGLDGVWAKEFSEEVEAKFTAWAESFNHWPDAAQRNTFTALIRLAVGVYLTSGEFLATVEWMRDLDRPYRTAIQPIELNRLCNPWTTYYDYNRTRGGVRLSASGVPLGYHIRRGEVGAFGMGEDQFRWAYIRAKTSRGRPQVIHIVEQDRPSQTRGMSQLVSALKEMRITKRFRDVALQNAVINASFAAAIESELPSSQVFEALGSGDVGASVVGYARDFLGAVNTYADKARNMSVDGAKIPHLMPGTKLNLQPLGTPGGIGSDFESSLIRYLAANLNVSYSELSKDYSKTSYSSERAGMIETWKGMRARKRVVADSTATLIYRLWFEEAVNAGHIEAMNAQIIPNMYDRMNMEAFCNAEWIGAGRGQIDEYKETQAAVLRIKTGLSTYEEEIGRMGRDWRVVFEQTAREKERMEELEIVPQEMGEIQPESEIDESESE